MLKILEKHHTFGELFRKGDDREALMQFPGTVSAAAYSRRNCCLAAAVSDGRVYSIDAKGRKSCIRESGDIISDIAFDWNGRQSQY